MGLIKNSEIRGVTSDWYYRVISYAVNIVSKPKIDKRVTNEQEELTELVVKLGRYGKRGGQMIDYATYVLYDMEKDEEVSMTKVYSRIKQFPEFQDAEDVFEENQVEEPEGSF